MAISGYSIGAASFAEERRLVAGRRGPVRTWFNQRPQMVTWLLIVVHCIFHPLISVVAVSSVVSTESHDGMWLPIALMVSVTLVGAAAIYFRYWRPVYLYVILQLLETLAESLVYLKVLGLTIDDVPGFGISVMVLFYVVASSVSPRTAFALYGITVFVYALRGMPVLFPRAQDILMLDPNLTTGDRYIMYISTWLISALAFLTLLVLGRSARRSRIFEREILSHFAQTQELAATEERSRIAREMHDVIAHSLTVMITLADGARFVAKKNPEQAGEVLKELSSTGRNALADMRRTLGVLRGDERVSYTPAEGAAEDSIDNLRELTESFQSTGLSVSFTHRGEHIPADNNLRLSLYRILQESLTNSLRYGQGARNIKVTVAVDLPDIRLTVINDGALVCELPASSVGSGKGITGMRERASFHGGTIEAGALPDGGWRVEAHLKSLNG